MPSPNTDAGREPWPSLPYEAGQDTYATLHMWTQMAGKIALAHAPPLNRSWAVAMLVDLLISWFLLSVAYGCWLLTNATWETYTATMDWFRTGYIYAAVGISMLVMTFLLLLDMFERAMHMAGRAKGTTS